MKIGIIGTGNVGGMTAMRLCSLGFKKIVLVDALPNFALAKSLDLNDASFILKKDYAIKGSNNIDNHGRTK